LSTALLTAKNGLETTVFDTDESELQTTALSEFFGVDSVDGPTFITRARSQVERHGVDFRDERVDAIEVHGSEFTLSTERQDYAADYVVLACGRHRGLADDLDCERNDDGTVAIDRDCCTSVRQVYAVGLSARELGVEAQIQVTVSVGDGAAAALDILSRESTVSTRGPEAR
jgi:thioredoxin reductase